MQTTSVKIARHNPEDRRYILLAQLANYDDAEQLLICNKIRSFVIANSRCFDRELIEGHVTASAFIVNPTGDKALMMHHKKYGFWTYMGGHCDGNPNTLEVALKEAKEESGIENIKSISDAIFDLTIHNVPKVGNEPPHCHYDIRYLMQAQHENFTKNHESNALRWFNKKEIIEMDIEKSAKNLAIKYFDWANTNL